MAVASFRRQAGMNEIKNKEKKIQEELKARQEKEKPVEISEDEHKKRLELLKSLGILKEG
jgi:membrane protein insertase Oxa1/YidC/SpoIIIJ